MSRSRSHDRAIDRSIDRSLGAFTRIKRITALADRRREEGELSCRISSRNLRHCHFASSCPVRGSFITQHAVKDNAPRILPSPPVSGGRYARRHKFQRATICSQLRVFRLIFQFQDAKDTTRKTRTPGLDERKTAHRDKPPR